MKISRKTFSRTLRVAAVVIMTAMHSGCADSSVVNTESKNTNPTPPDAYTGVWTVYSTNTGVKCIEAHYDKGQKHGVEMRWYPDTGYKMSLHTFDHGTLDGAATKWRNDKHGDIIVDGIFRSGQPWEGTFLEGWDREIDLSLDVVERNVPYWVRQYKAGKMLKRFEQP